MPPVILLLNVPSALVIERPNSVFTVECDQLRNCTIVLNFALPPEKFAVYCSTVAFEVGFTTSWI